MDAGSQHYLDFANLNDRSDVWVTAEMAQALEDLRTLDAESPVGRLPPELLCIIFSWVATFCAQHPSWIRATHVCRQWRDVALQCQALWTHITPLHPSELLAASFQRAGTSPLQLTYKNAYIRTYRQSLDFTDGIRPHTSRFSVIDVLAPPCAVRNVIHKFRSPMPHLESLTLTAKAIGLLEDDEPFELPLIFVNNVPSLLHLSLRCATPPTWELPMFRGLKTLHVAEQRRSLAPTMDQFLNVLQNCSLLEELSLRNAGPTLGRQATSYPEPTRVVELRHVREVSIANDYFFDIPYILAHLGIPATSRLDVQYLGYDYPHKSALHKHCMPRNSSLLRPLSAITLLRMAVHGGMIQTTGVAQDTLGPDPLICVSTRRPRTMHYPDKLLYETFCELPAAYGQAKLKHLDVHVPIRFTKEEDWEVLFDAFPALETLAVSLSDVRMQYESTEYVQKIFKVLGTRRVGFGRGTPVPNLATLCLHNCSYVEELRDDALACLRARRSDSVFMQLLINSHSCTLDSLEADQ